MNAILDMGDSAPLTQADVNVIKQAEEIIEKNNKPKHYKKQSRLKIFLIIFCVLLFLAAIFCTIFSLININNDKILSNISIMGVNVEKLSKEEAKIKINEEIEKRLAADIIFKHNEQTYSLIPNQVDLNYDVNKAIEEAYMLGRSGNIFENNFEILNLYINETNIIPDITYNVNLFESVVPQMEQDFTDGIRAPSYTIEGTDLNVYEGKDGYEIQTEELKNELITKLTAKIYTTDPIVVPVKMAQKKQIDVRKIRAEIYKEAVDAYFTKDPYKIQASSNGLDFAISEEEAQGLITGNAESYVIPLKILYPNVTTDQIGIEAFPNILSSYSTSYATSNSNRSTNIALAASKINGIVLMPGETFSYNASVGRRTIQAGFKEAGAYVNGKVTNEVGGGICQVSSTLYNAVLRANLEVVERTNHMFAVGYVPIGTDATVSWGAPDFKFKNNRTYAIKIVATTAGKQLYIKIYGLQEEGDCEVQILSYRTGTVGYRTTYTTDSSLEPGATKVIQSGSNGATSVTYKILKQNGQEISREIVSRDTYQPHNQIIARGN